MKRVKPPSHRAGPENAPLYRRFMINLITDPARALAVGIGQQAEDVTSPQPRRRTERVSTDGCEPGVVMAAAPSVPMVDLHRHG